MHYSGGVRLSAYGRTSPCSGCIIAPSAIYNTLRAACSSSRHRVAEKANDAQMLLMTRGCILADCSVTRLAKERKKRRKADIEADAQRQKRLRQ